MKTRLLVLAIIVSLLFTGSVLAAIAPKIFVDGREIVTDVAPTIVDSRTMVPFRTIAESLGAKLEWDAVNKTVNVTSGVELFLKNPARLTGPKALKTMLEDNDLKTTPLLLDGRSKGAFDTETIPGAIFIDGYTKMLEPANRAKLDAAIADHFAKTGNKKVVTFCGSGHGGMQLATVMSSLGYEMTALKYGWGGWTSDVTDFSESVANYNPSNTAAAAAYLKRPGRLVTPPDLKVMLEDNDVSTTPLLVDTRRMDSYTEGTIPGAIWIDFYVNMMEPENLAKLDVALAAHYEKTGNKKIIVWCTSGHGGMQLAAALSIAGYDQAAALMYGWSGWTGDDARFVESVNTVSGPVEIPDLDALNLETSEPAAVVPCS